MSRVSIGVLQPGARPVGIGVMGARRGVAMFGGAPQAVIVKSCAAPELAAECFCALLADALVCANIEAVAVSHSLTLPMGCEASASSELAAHPVIAGFAKPFAAQVTARLPALASSIKGLL